MSVSVSIGVGNGIGVRRVVVCGIGVGIVGMVPEVGRSILWPPTRPPAPEEPLIHPGIT